MKRAVPQALRAIATLSLAACGLTLSPGSDTGGSEDGGADLTASSSGQPTASSSGAPSCPLDYQLDEGDGTCPRPVCSREGSSCVGAAANQGDGACQVALTQPGSGYSAGALWLRLNRPAETGFTLQLEVDIAQAEAALKRPGHGFAVALVSSEEPSAAPGVDEREGFFPLLGVGQLPGVRGEIAYLRTLDDAGHGVLQLKASGLPTLDPSKLDAWDEPLESAGFDGTESVRVQMTIERRSGAPALVTARREDGTSLGALKLDLSSLSHLDYVGVAAARGYDNHSNSIHRIVSLSLTCRD